MDVLARCLADVLGNLFAGVAQSGVVAAITTATAAVGVGGAAVSAAPLVVLGGAFFALRAWLDRPGDAQGAKFERWLRDAIDEQSAERRTEAAERLRREFDADLDHETILRRLDFLREAAVTLRHDIREGRAVTRKLRAWLEGQLELQRDHLLVLERIFQSRFGELLEQGGRTQQLVADVRALLDDQPELEIPLARHDPRKPWGAMRYQTRAVHYVGQETLRHALRDFVDARDGDGRLVSFAWALMVGPGGAGKSRTALEWCLQFEATHRVGFLREKELGERCFDDWESWTPREPTLIVVDYVARYARRVGEILAALGKRCERNPLLHPVRILLIERDTPGAWDQTSWGKQLLRDEPSVDAGAWCRMREMRRSARAGPDREKYGPLVLPELPPDDLWRVMLDLFAQYRINPPAREPTLKQLAHLDPEARPLFAVLLAHFLTENRALAGVEWTMDTLLGFALIHERKRWENAQGDVDGLHLNLLCLATLCGGIARSLDNDPLALLTDTDLFPRPSQFKRSLFETLTDLDAAERLERLQPDIVGEFFVQEHLLAMDRVQFESIVRAAWRLRPADHASGQGVAYTIVRSLFDLGPGQMEQILRLNGVLPIDAPAREVWAALQTDLVALFVDSPEIFNAILNGLRQLRVADDRPEIRELVAGGLYNALTALGIAGRVDQALLLVDEMRQLRAADDRPEIRERFAHGLVNATTHFAGNLEQVLTLLHDLRHLRGADDQPQIREQLAKGLVNAINHCVTAGQRGQVVPLLDELRELRASDDRPIIREQLAKGLVNATYDLGARERLDVTLTLLRELHALRAADDRPEIRVLFADGLFNAITNCETEARLEHVPALLNELRDLRAADDRPEIRERLATVLVNAISNFGAAAKPEQFLTLLEELRELHAADDRPEIREPLTRGLVNVIVHSAGQLERALALLGELQQLARGDASMAQVEALGRGHALVASHLERLGRDAEPHWFYARSIARRCPPLAAFLRNYFPRRAP